MEQVIRDLIYQILEAVKPIDVMLFKLINQKWVAGWADKFMPLITDLHKTSWFFYLFPIVILLIVGKKFKSHSVLIVVGLALCLGVSDWAGGKIKRSIPRPRPFQVHQTTEAIKKSPAADDTSFYSNHSANNFAFAVYMSFFMPVLSWLFYPIAFLIAYSRVYNGVHYPSDVIFGALMGILWGKAFSHLVSRFLTNELHKLMYKEELELQKSGLSKSLHPGKK